MQGVPSRILIVDDEESLLSSLAIAVRGHGYDVDTALNGLVALERLEERRYALVVTDLRMPDLAGAEFLRRMREAGMNTPVVVITGHATLDAAVDCLQKGASDFLIKPFEVEALLASVEKALARSSVAQQGQDWQAIGRSYALTSRQIEVLEAFHSTGKTNRELAEHLCLTTHTVKSHLKAAFRKLGVTSRTQLLQVIAKVGR